MRSYKRILVVLFLLLTLSGCASSLSNVITYGDEYYRDSLAKSKNTQELKEYLKQNNIKFSSLLYQSNLPAGGHSSIMLGGQLQNFTSKVNSDWNKSIIFNVPHIELSGLLTFPATAGYILTFCADFTHAHIGEDGNSGSMEYSYFLSKMTGEEVQLYLKPHTMLSDCEISGLLGNVFYMKKVHVSSNPSIAKVSAVLKDKSQPLKPLDNLSLISRDMADQATTAMLTDGEMLQAFKAFRLTGDKQPQSAIPMATSPFSHEPINENKSLSLDGFKTQCQALGFKVGTTAFGNCVLELNEAK